MRERIQNVLHHVTADRSLEGRWLHTLSLLEFTGARKISRTVAAHHPSLEVLHHWADETRHAFVFMELAERLLGHPASSYLCGDEAKAYFSGLDRALTDWLSPHAAQLPPAVPYLLVTVAIERRAMTFYPIYRAATQHPFVREELSKVIVEEQSHRRALEEACLRQLSGLDYEQKLAALEEPLFESFWRAVERTTLPNSQAA